MATGSGRSARVRARRLVRRSRRLLALALGPVMVAATSLPAVVAVAAGAAAVTAVSAAVAAAPADAASTCTGSVLVFPDSVNGGSSSAEAAEATALGCSVTLFSSSAVSGMTQVQMETYFGGFSAIIIGDPSTTSCSATVPADALQYAPDWGPAIKANVAVLGTAPVLAGTAGKTLLDDAITYAVTGGASGNTGLYASLNCDYSTAAAGTTVPLLASVGGGGFTVTGQSSHCPDAGTVNPWQVLADAPFTGLATANLGTWSSPACSVEETLTGFTAGLSGLAYDAAATPATFTASTGATGQAYVLAGTLPTAATLALAPSQGGEVPAGTTTGGANPAAAGVAQPAAADPVNTESGDFTQSSTDLSIPTYGPPLSFARSYDSDAAQQQVQTGKPGAMGYGWTDNWASNLTPGRPIQGDIYTLAGLRTDNNNGASPTSAAVGDPSGLVFNGGNAYLVDTAGDRILEVPGTSGTQWGIAMTAGDTYVVAADGMPYSWDVLNHPMAVAFDSAGDLYVADAYDNRVEEIPVSTKTQWGVSLTADQPTTIAGNAEGVGGSGGDGGLASSANLYSPGGLAFDSAGNLYIGDGGNNRVQEVATATGSQWGQSMTANDIYTIAGAAWGSAGDGGPASAADLDGPTGITVDSSGDVIIADTGNNRIQEIAKSSGTQWGQSMTANDIYTVAGSATAAAGTSGDGGTASSALLDGPQDVVWSSSNIYVADSLNNRVQEVAGSTATQWGQSMTSGDIYTVAGSAAGTAGYSGDGGAATSADLNDPMAVALDGSGNLYIGDANNNRVREVSKSTADISTYAGDGDTAATIGDGGPATAAALDNPQQEAFDSHGDVYIADAGNNRIQEIAAYNHAQYGISMTAGDVYTIAGQADGQSGCQCDGHLATQAFLNDPLGVVIDPSGDLYIADAGNSRIQEVPNSTGTQWGQSMTLGYMYTIAGNQYGSAGTSGDGGPAGSALLNKPMGLTMDSKGDIYIADQWNNRIQEIAAVTGTQWGQPMTAGDIYTIAGSATGAEGSTGDGGPATAALLQLPIGVALDSAGNLYIGDLANNRVQEVAAVAHAQWGQSMTAADMYTVAGGTWGSAGDGGAASASTLDGPEGVAVDPSGDLYFTDSGNNRVQEIANSDGTQWGQSMTVGDIYTVAGSPTGTSGNAGDGGPATGALMDDTQSVSLDPEGDLYITDNANDTVREVASAIPAAIPPAPGQTSSLAIAPSGAAPGGLTITQPGGSQVTFWAKTGGSCASQYVATGSYCILPQDQGATLAYNSGTYTFSPAPGYTSYAYSSTSGQLTSEADIAGNTLTITNNSPAPGGTVTGNGTCPSTAVSCQTITSASGRALVLGWNGTNDSGQVTSVTDPMNRTWTYAYNGSGQLSSVTDPMTNKTSYTYGAGTSGNPLLADDMLTITKPNAQPGGPDAGDSTVNVYDTSGRVTQQTDPMGWKTAFNYCVSVAAGDCMDAATGSGFVTVTDPDGNSTVYDYDQGALAAQTFLTGSTLTSSSEEMPDTTAASANNPSGGTLEDTSATNGDGDSTTTAFNADGNPTSSTAPGANGTSATITSAYTASLQEDSCDGTQEAASTATCSQDPGPSPVTRGGVITPPASAPPIGLTYTLYDNDGNDLYSTTGVYSPAGSYSYSRTTYQLFKGNSITLNSVNTTCSYTPPSASLPCATINADGVVTQLEYDSAGDLELSSAPDGNSGGQLATTKYTFDGDREQLTKVAPDGNITGGNAGNYTITTAWNADGKQTSATQGNGSGYTDTPRVTYYGYDGDGNQTTVKDARAYTTTTTFNADDKPTLVTNPDNDATLTCYDGDGHTVQTVPPVGVAANSLSPASCPTAYPAGYGTRLGTDATVYTFSALGFKTQQTAPAPAGQSGSETTSYTYDAGGDLLTTTTPAATNGGSSQVTTDAYNSAGQLASQTTGTGSSTSTVSYCYNPDGQQTSVVYADGNTGGTAACSTASPWTVTATPQANYQTTDSYDSVGDLVATTTPKTTAAPSGGTTTATYDPAGNMLTRKDPNGVTTTWTYTPLNLAASASYSGSSAHSVTESYDADGNKTGMTDATGTSSYTYDPFGELTSGDNGASQTTSYGYNADGEISSITYPLPSSATWATSKSVSYGYDNADELTAVTDFNGHIITIGNTADGLPNSEGLGSTGDTIATNYDAADSPSVIALKNSSSTLQSFTYSDSPAGTILSETDIPASSQSPADYAYDNQGRIISDTPGTGSAKDYSFDASSNLTTLPTGASATTGYDDAGELVSSTLSGTATDYTYNADGEQLTSAQGSTTESTATWNGATQLATYDNAIADMTAATYDGTGTLASSTITPAGKGAVTQGYVWDTAQQVPEMIMDGANAYIYDGGTGPAEQVSLSAGTVTYLVTDSLGSVRGTVSAAGALTGTADYDAWGNPLTAGGLIAATPFGYAGAYTQPTGLIYLLNRYYQPSTGQFLSVDPEIAQTLQPYEYAGGNPVSVTDPTGESWCDSVGWRSHLRECYYYWSQYDDLHIKHDLELGIALSTICGFTGFAGGICWLIDGILALGYWYIDDNDFYNDGTYAVVEQERLVVTWWFWGSHHWDSPWWDYNVYLESAY